MGLMWTCTCYFSKVFFHSLNCCSCSVMAHMINPATASYVRYPCVDTCQTNKKGSQNQALPFSFSSPNFTCRLVHSSE